MSYRHLTSSLSAASILFLPLHTLPSAHPLHRFHPSALARVLLPSTPSRTDTGHTGLTLLFRTPRTDSTTLSTVSHPFLQELVQASETASVRYLRSGEPSETKEETLFQLLTRPTSDQPLQTMVKSPTPTQHTHQASVYSDSIKSSNQYKHIDNY
jgi:hypothetical protein